MTDKPARPSFDDKNETVSDPLHDPPVPDHTGRTFDEVAAARGLDVTGPALPASPETAAAFLAVRSASVGAT